MRAHSELREQIGTNACSVCRIDPNAVTSWRDGCWQSGEHFGRSRMPSSNPVSERFAALLKELEGPTYYEALKRGPSGLN
jgi:hypothetical protein